MQAGEKSASALEIHARMWAGFRQAPNRRARNENSLTLTLTPKSSDSGLDILAISKFPFLVSKTDATFSRYKNKGPHDKELAYLSRRHAYIQVKDGQPYIEDLGSGNGTCIDGQPLAQAVPLEDGSIVAGRLDGDGFCANGVSTFNC